MSRRVTVNILFQLVHDFLKIYLPEQRNSSQHTIDSYRTSLELLFDFVKQDKKINLNEITFEMLDNQIVIKFLNWLEKTRGCSVTTRNQRLACIRAFYSYAASAEITAVIYYEEFLKIPQKKSSEPDLIDYMRDTSIKVLLEQPDTKTQKGLRDQFFMVLMYDTAARLDEMLSLKIKDIRLGSNPTARLFGKGSKVRTVPLMSKTIEHFKSYMEIFHKDEDSLSDSFLFYILRNDKKCKMSSDNVQKFIREYGESARIICPEIPEKVHPHLFRHSRAMHLYQHGMDLTLISQWLGHANLETTLVYAHADTEKKRKAIEAATDGLMKNLQAVYKFDVNDDEVLKRLYGLK